MIVQWALNMPYSNKDASTRQANNCVFEKGEEDDEILIVLS